MMYDSIESRYYAGKITGRKEKIAALWAILHNDQKRWAEIYQNGCSDPYHADGINLNLVRNHILNDCNGLRRMGENPDGEFVPNIVNPNLMIKGKYFNKRYKRLTQCGERVSVEGSQISLF